MDDVFRVNVTRSKDGARLALVGELDASTSPRLRDCIEAVTTDASGVEHVVIDLTDLTFIDSTGLDVLAAAQQRSVDSMSARHPCRGVRRVFEVTGLAHLLEDEA